MERNGKELSVLNAAASVFLAHGYSAATTDMIQRKAGVSKATMYACFPNKEAMFTAMIEEKCAEMSEAIQAIEAAPGDIAGMLTALGMAYLEIILSPNTLALFRVVVAEAPRFPELGRRFYQTAPQFSLTMIAGRLGEAARAGEIDIHSVGAEAAASLFLSLLRGEGHLECLTHPDARPSAAQVNRWVQLAVTTFLGAFGARDDGVVHSAPKRKTR
jgi:AcrR family transcriptional regulator